MTVKNRLRGIILLAIAITIAISFTGMSISFAKENNEYYSDNSSVFSPGYLNAAKFEAETIIRQQTPPGKGLVSGLMAVVTDFVHDTAGALGALIGKEKNEKLEVTPSLQHKMSNPKGKGPAANAITILPSPQQIDPAILYSIVNYCGVDSNGTPFVLPNVQGDNSDQVALLNGKYYAVWNDEEGSNKVMIFDSNGSPWLTEAKPILENASYPYYPGYRPPVGTIKVFACNDGISVFWDYDAGGGLQCQTLDPSGNTTLQYDDATKCNDLTTRIISYDNIGQWSLNTVALSNGAVAVEWVGGSGDDPANYGMMFKLLPSEGEDKFGSPQSLNVDLSSGDPVQIGEATTEACLEALKEHGFTIGNGDTANLNDINVTPEGIRVSWNDSGNINATDALKSPYSKDSSGYFSDTDPRGLDKIEDKTNQGILGNSRDLSDIFRGLIADKDALDRNSKISDYDNNYRQMVKGPLGEASMAVPLKVNGEGIEAAVNLANIVKNPAGEQKFIIDSIKALLADMAKLEESLKKPFGALKKAEDALLSAGAEIILAQAIPDLLKKGDIDNIRAVFSDLDTEKKNILTEYEKSAKLYYESVLKDFERNISALQLMNILGPQLTQAELDKLPRSEVDKILDKIKKGKAKTFEEEYILQQEAKYRKTYLEPAGKKLEEDIKKMMNDFTGKVGGILKAADKK